MRLSSPRWAPARKSFEVLVGDYRDTRRIKVINPSLCDDAINLLRPSLPRPASCDIIDINPGPCIWTKALHEALKPRRHILVEPPGSQYHDAVNSLTGEPNSKYRSVPTIAEALELSSLSDSFQNHYRALNEQQKGNVRRQVTDELIITANLSGKQVTTESFHGPPSMLFLDHFYRSIAFDAGAYEFNKYGLVRLLAWIPEQEKDRLIPKSIHRRSRANKNFEASCYIREIVSSSSYHSLQYASQPWHDVAMESRRRAMIRQNGDNIQIPPNRQQPLPLPPPRYYEPIPENFDKLLALPKRSNLVDDFIKLWHLVKADNKKWLEKYVQQFSTDQPSKREGRSKADTPSKTQLIEDFSWVYNRMRLRHSKYEQTREMVDTQMALEQELISFRNQHSEDYEGYLKLLETIGPKLEILNTQTIKSYKDTRAEVLKAVDDYRALYHDPPVLAWHNRPHEPLLSHPTEDFQPCRQPLSLIEMVPKTSFLEAIDTSDKQIAFDYVASCFDTLRLISVKKAIEEVVGEGELYEDFIPSLASLTDPLHGGWYNLNDARVRSLSVEAMVKIALAYEAWPYRMSIEKMLERSKGFGRGVIKGPLD